MSHFWSTKFFEPHLGNEDALQLPLQNNKSVYVKTIQETVLLREHMKLNTELQFAIFFVFMVLVVPRECLAKPACLQKVTHLWYSNFSVVSWNISEYYAAISLIVMLPLLESILLTFNGHIFTKKQTNR